MPHVYFTALGTGSPVRQTPVLYHTKNNISANAAQNHDVKQPFLGIAGYFRHLLRQAFDAGSKVLCHEARFNGLNADFFQGNCKVPEASVVVQLSSVSEASCPCEDGG